MARTSNRGNTALNTYNSGELRWNAALYIRLSKEDGDNMESDSVVNQRLLLTNYMNNEEEISLFDYFTDDGYTGLNFNRPGFKRLISEIENGNVNCVIVKDLSRFGRDYVEVGRYLDEYFKVKKIRFIAINDKIDVRNATYDIMVPMKSIFNFQYSIDISNKVISTFRQKQKKGDFIGAFASFGYRKDPTDKNKLIIDDYAAEIVRRIYKLYAEGNGKIKIANILNSEHILCPSEYKKLNGLNYTNGNKLSETNYWTYPTIHRVLNNEMYTGNMVQHRVVRSSIKNKKNTAASKDEWIIVEGTHKPIIDSDLWETVQTLLQRDTRQIDFNQNIHIFAGFLFCGDCKRAMAKVNRHSHHEFVCGSYKRLGVQICSQHRIMEDDLINVVLKRLQSLIRDLVNIEKAVINGRPKKSNTYEADIQKRIHYTETQIEKTYRLRKGIYEDYKADLISRDDYLKMKEDYDRQRLQLEAQLKTLEESKSNTADRIIKSEWFETFIKYQNIVELDRYVISTLIDRIFICEDKTIVIEYKFTNEIKELMEIVK